jgi:hypothetical protein
MIVTKAPPQRNSQYVRGPVQERLAKAVPNTILKMVQSGSLSDRGEARGEVEQRARLTFDRRLALRLTGSRSGS